MIKKSTTLKRLVSGSVFGLITLSTLLFLPKIADGVFLLVLFLIIIWEYSFAGTQKKNSLVLIALLLFFAFRGYRLLQKCY